MDKAFVKRMIRNCDMENISNVHELLEKLGFELVEVVESDDSWVNAINFWASDDFTVEFAVCNDKKCRRFRIEEK